MQNDVERDMTMNQFRAGHITALICTSASIGIDVPQVDIVINYDIPVTSESFSFEPDYPNYLHRVGRTGRFQTDGLALTLYQTEGNIGMTEISHIDKIEKYYQMQMEEIDTID